MKTILTCSCPKQVKNTTHAVPRFRGAHVSQSGAPRGIPSGFNVTTPTWTNDREVKPNIVLKVHTLFSLFFFFFFAYYVVWLLTVLKSRCSIISAPGFIKRPKQRTNLVRRSSPENYYSSGCNTELKLCRLWSTYIGGDAFWTVNDHNASDSSLLFLCLLLSALPSLC